MKRVLIASAVASIMALSGCATILNDDNHKANIQTSDGQKAVLNVDGKRFEAPGVVELPRKKEGVTISSVDNRCNDTNVNSKVDTKFFVNILSGGAFGSTTDYATDKMWTYDDTIVVQCR
ncbi:hypothetical protein [Thiomicrospira microaerophila]|uniref:hypothetical protein n=1 Tax=Thiomicrospira microaerophila TaxID=406020 RepID=UPI0005CA8D74|nr:hypothetical protein [Thiomicrospira microaerophila]